MKSTFNDLWVAAALVVLSAGPAHATLAQNLPEPTTMGLVGAGIAAVVVAARLRGRK